LKAYISVGASSYQLPLKYRDRTVEIYLTKHQLFVFDLYTQKEIIAYELSPIPGKILSKREYGRETEKTAKELKALVSEMFESKSWKSFTARNFKTFSRYVRDQCLEAKRYFLVKDIDLDILEQALKYCLENDTVSFSNLNDTYAYFERASQGSHDILKEVPTLDRLYQGAYEPLEVTERNLSVYKELIGKSKGVLI